MTHQEHVETVFALLEQVASRDGLDPAGMQHVLQHVLAVWICTTAGFLYGDGEEFQSAINAAARDTEKLIRETASAGDQPAGHG